MKRLSFARLSIRQRFSLLMCTLLPCVVLIFGIISYLGVRNAELNVGKQRLQTLSLQLSSMFSGNTHSLITSIQNVANKESVKSLLLSDGRDSVFEVMKLFREIEKDSATVHIELKDAALHPMMQFSKKGIQLNISVDTILTRNLHTPIDSGEVGKLYASGDSIFYPVMTSISSGNRTIGYLVRWRMMQNQSKTVEQLSQLMGSDAKIFIGNADGTVWTDMVKKVWAPPFKTNKTNRLIGFNRPRVAYMLAFICPIANSEWLVSLEFPKNKMMQAANNFLYLLIVTAILLVVGGILLGWRISRNFSLPLTKLTSAASEIASGNHASAVMVNRQDELGKLARAFNSMAVQIRNSKKALEEKAENYKLLFEKNPMPMFILCKSTLNVMDVNQAAIKHYGYSKEEFLLLNSKDLRPGEDVHKFLSYLDKDQPMDGKYGIWRHKKKDGTVIMVDLIADDIIFSNEPARLVLAHDVTEKLKAEEELMRHRVMQQQIITETTILVQEKEREEIGKELHDNINQILASTKLYLELARNDDSRQFPEAITKSYENINLAIGEIRQLSKQLIRPAFDTTLADSLKDLTEEIRAITPIDISFHATAIDESLLAESIKLMIYRIVQEQINNILKHAAASEVEIKMRTCEGNLLLHISDNGVGFDTTQKSKGIGLRNIHNRVKFHRGTAKISSTPGAGCCVEISVPLEMEARIII